MTAYTKAAKRRAKKARNGIENLYRQWEATAQSRPHEPDDPLATVKQARQRLMGRQGDFTGKIYCEEAGRAIAALAVNEDEANRLWNVFLKFDTADNTYMARVIGRPRFPNVAKMEFLPDRLEARDDDKPDPRSEDEKDRDAVNTWMHWQGHLGCLEAHERSSIVRAARHMDTLWKDGGPTCAGQQFVAALRVLHAVVDGTR